MLNTVTQWMEGFREVRWNRALRAVLEPIADRMSSQPLKTAGLVIKAGGGVLAKIGAVDFYATAAGVPVTIAASTDMTSLLGLVITAAKFNVACFFVDSASVVTVAFGTEGAALANITWPQFPKNKALVGALIITHSGTFTGNTTALDTATTVYLSPVGAFDPTILI